METGSLRYEGRVKGQGRPRGSVVRSAGRVSVGMHKDPRDRSYERALASLYEGPRFPKGVPVAVEVVVMRSLPASLERKTRRVTRHDVFKPDADNILKSVLDALTGVAYEDDSQVTTAVVRKMDQVPADGTDVLVVSVRADEVLGGGDVVECELHEG